MIESQSYIQWNLLYKGELMLSPDFSSLQECLDYIQSSPHPDADYQVVSRIVVEQRSAWAVWK